MHDDDVLTTFDALLPHSPHPSTSIEETSHPHRRLATQTQNLPESSKPPQRLPTTLGAAPDDAIPWRHYDVVDCSD
jgi:hypothetical protein